MKKNTMKTTFSANELAELVNEIFDCLTVQRTVPIDIYHRIVSILKGDGGELANVVLAERITNFILKQVHWIKALEDDARKAKRELQRCEDTLYGVAFGKSVEVPDWRAAYSDNDCTPENPFGL